MTLWQDEPETEGTTPSYRILRTPAGRAISGICLSTTVVGAKLHYWKGRSKPHVKADCEACSNGHIARWKGYVLLYCPKSHAISILEFTERIWPDFLQFSKSKGTLRGAQITLKRMNNKQNGPLQVRFEEHLFDQTGLPKEGNLREMLARIWEVRQKTLPSLVDNDSDLTPTKELRLA